MTDPPPTRPVPSQAGFALVLVLGVIAVAATLATGLATTTRYETRRIANAGAAAEARTLLDAGVALGVLGASDPDPARRLRTDGTPRVVDHAGGRIALRVFEEAGRIDLNRQPVARLAALFSVAGVDNPAELAQSVAAWRGDSGDGTASPDGLPRRPFLSVEELSAVPGVPPESDPPAGRGADGGRPVQRSGSLRRRPAGARHTARTQTGAGRRHGGTGALGPDHRAGRVGAGSGRWGGGRRGDRRGHRLAAGPARSGSVPCPGMARANPLFRRKRAMTAPPLGQFSRRPAFQPLAGWFLAEVVSWLPPSWRSGAAPVLLAVRAEGRVHLMRRDGQPLDRAPRRGTRVVVRPGVKALHRRCTLPAAAAGHLRAIVANQIDRRTPWPADQVWFDAAPLGPGEDERTIDVRLTVIPRTAAEAPLDAVRALALIPTALEVEDGLGGWIALPLTGGDTPSATARARRWWPALAAAALLAALLGPPLWDRAAATAALEEARQAAADVRRLAAALEDRQAASAYAERRKAETPAATVVLEVLSRILSDDVWLSELHLDAGTVLLVGQAADANRLPALLSASRHFADVQFRSAVVREPAGGDRFQLSARVVPHDAP